MVICACFSSRSLSGARLVRLARDGSVRLAAAICRKLAAVTVRADPSAFCRLVMSSVGLKATCEVGAFGSTVASPIVGGPRHITAQREEMADGLMLQTSHDGYGGPLVSCTTAS